MHNLETYEKFFWPFSLIEYSVMSSKFFPREPVHAERIISRFSQECVCSLFYTAIATFLTLKQPFDVYA